MPTFTRCTGRHVTCLLCLAEEFAAGTAAATDEFMSERDQLTVTS